MEDDSHWIINSKYLHEKKWFCHFCDKITEVELNPEWVKAGSPLRWKGDLFQWFARCSECHTDQLSGGDGCPACGWNNFPEEPYIVKKRLLHRKSLLINVQEETVEKKYPVVSNFGTGGVPWDGQYKTWDEMHYCPWHGEFTIKNAGG